MQSDSADANMDDIYVSAGQLRIMRKSMRKHEIWLIVLTAGVYDTLWNYVQSTEVVSIMLFQRLLISPCERGVVGWVEGTWPNFFVHTIGKKIKTCGVFSLKFWKFNSQMLTFASSGQQAFSPTRGRRSVSLEQPGNSALLMADKARNLFCFVSKAALGFDFVFLVWPFQFVLVDQCPAHRSVFSIFYVIPIY